MSFGRHHPAPYPALPVCAVLRPDVPLFFESALVLQPEKAYPPVCRRWDLLQAEAQGDYYYYYYYYY